MAVDSMRQSCSVWSISVADSWEVSLSVSWSSVSQNNVSCASFDAIASFVAKSRRDCACRDSEMLAAMLVPDLSN